MAKYIRLLKNHESEDGLYDVVIYDSLSTEETILKPRLDFTKKDLISDLELVMTMVFIQGEKNGLVEFVKTVNENR